MEQSRDWARECAADIGKRVALYRERQKISGQQLADRCAGLGMPSISRIVITKLENGRREVVSTAELQVLAAALGVQPVVLLTGLGTAETVEILPGEVVDPYDAVRWLTGETGDPRGAPPPEGSPMALYGLHHYLLSRWEIEQRKRDRILDAAKTSEERLKAARETFEVMLADSNADHLRTIRETMRSLGYLPPRLPADVALALGEEVPDGPR